LNILLLVTITGRNKDVLFPDRVSILESEHCECADSHLLKHPVDHTVASFHGLFSTTSAGTRTFAPSATTGAGHQNCGAEPRFSFATTTLQASELDNWTVCCRTHHQH
jgi:hypothetical protein